MMIETERYLLRPLQEGDATPRYLSWFSSEAAQRIQSSPNMSDLQRLKSYIREKSSRSDVLFLAILERTSMRHIGNIKFEPVDPIQGYAIMGIFIGEDDLRGKGVAPEVLSSCAQWLAQNQGISQIILGVERDNLAAIKAYQKAGFIDEETPRLPSTDKHMSMILHANIITS